MAYSVCNQTSYMSKRPHALIYWETLIPVLMLRPLKRDTPYFKTKRYCLSASYWVPFFLLWRVCVTAYLSRSLYSSPHTFPLKGAAWIPPGCHPGGLAVWIGACQIRIHSQTQPQRGKPSQAISAAFTVGGSQRVPTQECDHDSRSWLWTVAPFKLLSVAPFKIVSFFAKLMPCQFWIEQNWCLANPRRFESKQMSMRFAIQCREKVATATVWDLITGAARTTR